jgi:hypothetical protein|nr:MAG TPA: hypothetical protein [Caudoviricetes sp.]
MTPKPINSFGYEVFDGYVSEKGAVALFSGYCGHAIQLNDFEVLKRALSEPGHDLYPGPRSIYARMTRGAWGASKYEKEDFAGHGDEECDIMRDLLEIAFNKLDRDNASEEKRYLMKAYLTGWANAGNFLESPIFAYFKAEEYVKSVFGIEK